MKIQAKQLQQDLQTKRIVLLDVRTPIEHQETHLSGSISMPLDDLNPSDVTSTIAGADQCVLICRSGKRAERAFEKLQAAGCRKLAILDGGVDAWEAAGLPVIRTEKKHLPLMRQVQLIIGLLALTSSILALTVNKNFAFVPAFLGAGLTLAGSTGWCGLAILLSKMPWNKVECGECKVTSCSI